MKPVDIFLSNDNLDYAGYFFFRVKVAHYLNEFFKNYYQKGNYKDAFESLLHMKSVFANSCSWLDKMREDRLFEKEFRLLNVIIPEFYEKSTKVNNFVLQKAKKLEEDIKSAKMPEEDYDGLDKSTEDTCVECLA